MFCDREGGYNLRGKFNLKKTLCSYIFEMCDLWEYLPDGLDEELKRSTTIKHFKKMYRHNIFRKYAEEGG